MKLSQPSRLPPRWQARAMRTGFNLHPAFRSTGGRVEYVAPGAWALEVSGVKIPEHVTVGARRETLWFWLSTRKGYRYHSRIRLWAEWMIRGLHQHCCECG